MEILGVGPLELVFILLLVLIIFGPRDLQKAGRTLGRSLNKLVRSDSWRAFNQISRSILTFPNKLMRDANLDEMKDLPSLEKVILPPGVTPPSRPAGPAPQEADEHPTGDSP